MSMIARLLLIQCGGEAAGMQLSIACHAVGHVHACSQPGSEPCDAHLYIVQQYQCLQT